MFFNLARSPHFAFCNHYNLGQLILSTDNGWHRIDTTQEVFIYKGYLECTNWNVEVLMALEDNKELGNFICFRMAKDSGLIKMVANRWRGVMIWSEHQQYVSNLFQGSHTIWNDSGLIIDKDLVLTETKNNIIGEFEAKILDLGQVQNQLHAILCERIESFISNNRLPLKVFCSGGIDSTLVWSYIQRFTSNYELVLENRMQWDQFWCKNRKKILKNFWGYSQLHHWLEPCVLTSGTPGDEFMMRGPTTINLWCMYHGIDIFDLLKSKDFLHYEYFAQDKHKKLFRQQQEDRELDSVMRLSRNEFVRYICNINANDCQHWHLGNTLTFTPLRDMRVLQLILSLDVKDLLPQMLDSSISKHLIERNNPELLTVLSQTKNVGESLSNLAQFISR